MEAATSFLESIIGCVSTITKRCKLNEEVLKLNGRQYTLLRLLGEGGFSFVYLAKDNASGRLFALKVIRLGSESARIALKEVEAYQKFRHPNIIRCLDSCVIQDANGKVVYLFLPHYPGTVQDQINAHSVNGTKYSEKVMLSIFLGTCEAVRALHHYSGPSATSAYPPHPTPSTSMKVSSSTERSELEDDEEHDEGEGVMDNGGEEEALIGGLAGLKGAAQEESELQEQGKDPLSTNELDSQPWSHRDIKPANILITEDGQPILFDFGSVSPRVSIPNRSIALAQQDLAAEHCSMAFRAPELFDVKTDCDLTESVDIWSLGCTLYAMAYFSSPFETLQQSEYGGSVAMAAMSGKYSIPNSNEYSEGFKNLIREMLQVEPAKRADINQVIASTRKVLASLE